LKATSRNTLVIPHKTEVLKSKKAS